MGVVFEQALLLLAFLDLCLRPCQCLVVSGQIEEEIRHQGREFMAVEQGLKARVGMV